MNHSLYLSAPGAGADGVSKINGVTQNLLSCDSMSTTGEAADILCRYKKITKEKKKVTADLAGFSEYSPDISVSSHRGTELRHRQDLPKMYRPKKHFLSSWLNMFG